MKGYYQKRADGKMADCAPCRFCKYEMEHTVGPHCYNCFELFLHKPNAETEFVLFEAKSEAALAKLRRLQGGEFE